MNRKQLLSSDSFVSLVPPKGPQGPLWVVFFFLCALCASVANKEMRNFLDMTFEQLSQAVAAAGEKPFRAEQLADWVYRKGVTDPSAMSNLPGRLKEQFTFLTSRPIGSAVSTDGAVKLLLELHDGQAIECVLIPSASRATACLSTQVGCAMGCLFCASGAHGIKRNLSSGEVLEQLLHLWQATGKRPNNVVFMGMGEPLANYEATVAAVRAIIDPRRLGISARHVTVSTVGLPKQIRRLAGENMPITLAISLHAPNDALRGQIIPNAGKTKLEDILDAAEEFYRSRKREVTLEYLLLGGLNDTRLCAEALARIARRLRCNVNLIRYNPVPALAFQRPSQAATRAFADRLAKRGVNVNIRLSRGLDATAACGQLRLQSMVPSSGTQP